MEMIPVSSSNIGRVGYDATERTLRIEFLNGSTYEYFDVPENVFSELIAPGKSVGQYFSREVKGRYRYSRL